MRHTRASCWLHPLSHGTAIISQYPAGKEIIFPSRDRCELGVSNVGNVHTFFPFALGCCRWAMAQRKAGGTTLVPMENQQSLGGKKSQNGNKKAVVDRMDACTMTGGRSRRLFDCTGLPTLPAAFPPLVPTWAAGRAQQRGGVAGLGCARSGFESCSARATQGRVGITPCAEHPSPFLGKGKHLRSRGGAERGAAPTLPAAGRGGSWPRHHQSWHFQAMATLCSHSVDPQQTPPYPDGQSRAYLHQLQVLTEHRSTLASWVNEQQPTPSKTKHRHKC